MRRGTVYELGPREVRGAPRPAQPRINLDKPVPIWTDSITDTLPEGIPGVEVFDNPDYFAWLQYSYPDQKTGVLTDYRITTDTQTFQGKLNGSTGQLSLSGPEQICYDIGTPVTAEQWQQTREALQQACDELSEQRRHATPLESWPATIQPLHLLHTEVLLPGDPKQMDAALFNDQGAPLVSLFSTAQEIWDCGYQRPDIFARRLSQQWKADSKTLSSQLGQSFGVLAPDVPSVGLCLVDLIYLLDHECELQPLKTMAGEFSAEDPEAWAKEVALVALISHRGRPRPESRPGNQSPYFDSLGNIGKQLYRLAEQLRQQDKVFTQTEQHNYSLQKILKVPQLGSLWCYTAPVNRSRPKRILRLGVFFDGTNQNRYNDAQLPDRDISNVAKMQDLYLEQTIDRAYEIVTTRKIYISGVGTITGVQILNGYKVKEDMIGLGFGVGKEGGQARIAEALQQIQIRIKKDQYDELVFDVFGFSRGAALARHFINMINQWTAEYRPYGVLTAVKAFPQQLSGRVAFVGLWDTVGSFYWPGNDKQGEFNLNLNESSAEQVVHLVAAHEVRHNFPSTRISDAKGRLPANFTETIVPGVHADVGGGYENPTPGAATSFDDWRDFYRVKKVYDAGWEEFRVRQLQRDIERRGHTVMMQGTQVYELIPIHKELSIYPLRQMYDIAKTAGLPLREIKPNETAYMIPEDLAWCYQNWQNNGAELDNAKIYLEDYIHTSERGLSIVNTPGILFKSRQVFSNRPRLAITPRKRHENA
ncbi:T6SS phospholipase effector Tle1-like catalytic domain-containing protein [Gynuella sp.]|uniref:T6SS phospholipase effector Tle1-like catalytic domain-containing protein n=1 Tax=Gynuella sp. TaxID=2969146 RepID=UPI003D10BB30